MSGGHFDYIDKRLKDEIFGYNDKPTNVFEDREISNLVWDTLELIHVFDWYKSGDTCDETWLKRKKEFKNKWFKSEPERVKSVVDEALLECKEELYKTFSIMGEDEQ